MKRLSAAFALFLVPTFGQAACTGDLPTQNPLHVYADSGSDRIIGGIGPNHCGVEVTDLCASGRCLMFLDGLSGYVDVSALQSGSFGPALTVLEYGIADIGGELSFMGQMQAFQVAEDQPLRIEPRADHIVLSLPAPLPSGIRMVSTGSSGWEGQLPDWVGVRVPVTLYLDRLSAPRATLELSADHQLLKMNMRLTLTRLGGLSDQSVASHSQTPAPNRDRTDCETTHALAARIENAGE